jgi:hypothetical protein
MPLAPGCNRCKAEQWQRDGRGLWAKRACTGLASHGGSHSFGLWEHNPQTQNPTDELLAALRALVEIYGPSTDYSDVAQIAWADAEDAIARAEAK